MKHFLGNSKLKNSRFLKCLPHSVHCEDKRFPLPFVNVAAYGDALLLLAVLRTTKFVDALLVKLDADGALPSSLSSFSPPPLLSS